MFQPPRTRILYHVVIGVATGQSSEVLDSIRNRYTDSVMIIYIDTVRPDLLSGNLRLCSPR